MKWKRIYRLVGLSGWRGRAGLRRPEGVRRGQPVPAHVRRHGQRHGGVRMPRRLPAQRRRRQLLRRRRVRHRNLLQSALHQHRLGPFIFPH